MSAISRALVRRAAAGAIALCLTAAPLAQVAWAQGFAGLGGEAAGFDKARRDHRLEFPRDHGAHPGFRIEWWYVTANLTGPDGAAYGVQWTLFRQALAPGAPREGWASGQIWMGNAAVTSARRHVFAEKFARGGVGIAGVAAAPFTAWIDDWRLESVGAGFSPLRMRASGPEFGFDLSLATDRAMVLQGDAGYSVKSDRGQASHYVSQPFFSVRGALRLDGTEIAVTGRAWMDREWSSQPLAADQTGWDWFALHLDGAADGEKLMLFRLRDGDGAGFVSGTWIDADGRATPLTRDEIEIAPVASGEVAGRELPLRWRVAVPSRGFDVAVAPLNAEAWLATRFPYWEGPIRFSGSREGVGYLEMTGY